MSIIATQPIPIIWGPSFCGLKLPHEVFGVVCVRDHHRIDPANSPLMEVGQSALIVVLPSIEAKIFFHTMMAGLTVERAEHWADKINSSCAIAMWNVSEDKNLFVITDTNHFLDAQTLAQQIMFDCKSSPVFASRITNFDPKEKFNNMIDSILTPWRV